jgi:NADH-quinone oxidoreductase subunit J
VEKALFYGFAGLSVLASLVMITRRNPLSSALSLVVAFLGLAALYALLDAKLLFVVQIWVYAGAVMVLVLFVIMLLNLREEEARSSAAGWSRIVVAVAILAVAGWKAFTVLSGVRATRPPVSQEFGGVTAVAEILFTRYVVQFQIIGVLLMAVVVGVVALTKRASRGSDSRGR